MDLLAVFKKLLTDKKSLISELTYWKPHGYLEVTGHRDRFIHKNESRTSERENKSTSNIHMPQKYEITT